MYFRSYSTYTPNQYRLPITISLMKKLTRSLLLFVVIIVILVMFMGMVQQHSLQRYREIEENRESYRVYKMSVRDRHTDFSDIDNGWINNGVDDDNKNDEDDNDSGKKIKKDNNENDDDNKDVNIDAFDDNDSDNDNDNNHRGDDNNKDNNNDNINNNNYVKNDDNNNYDNNDNNNNNNNNNNNDNNGNNNNDNNNNNNNNRPKGFLSRFVKMNANDGNVKINSRRSEPRDINGVNDYKIAGDDGDSGDEEEGRQNPSQKKGRVVY